MDKFEKYYSYLGPSIIDGEDAKDRLVEMFKAWLDEPYSNDGCFVVRWAENDNLRNTTSLQDFVNTMTNI